MLATLRANIAATLLGLLAAILLVVSVVQTVQIHGFGIWPLKVPGLKAKYETAITKLVEARRDLEAISAKRNEQGERTGDNIKIADDLGRKADRVAERIEQAPLTGDCRTPDEVMRAGI